MARAGIVHLNFVIFFFALLAQNAHSTARYQPRMMMARVPEKSLTPIYSEIYQECRHQICPNSEDYPEQEILRVMRNTKNMQGLFGIVLNSTYDTIEVATRSSFFQGKAKKLCSTDTSETHTPRVLRNVELTWKFVVNVDGYYQRFTAEICRNSKLSSSSRRISNDSCTDFGYECRQSYQEVYLLTFENNIIDFDKFMIPTTCNCVCNL